MRIGELIDMNVRRNPDREAFVLGTDRITYRSFGERANRLANALLAQNPPNSNIAVLEENSIQHFEMVFGVPKAGMTFVPINYRLDRKEIVYIVNDCEATTLLVSSEYRKTVDEIRSELKTVRNFVLVDGQAEDYVSYEEMLARALPTGPSVAVDDDDVAWIIYTSGTTGRPKGAMLTHKGIFTHGVCYYLSGIAEKASRTLYAMPAFHVSMHSVVATVLGGGTVVLVKKFEPEQFMQVIEREKVTITGLAPTMINFVVNHPKFSQYDLSSLRQIGYGAAPISVDLLRKCLRLLGPIFVQVFGQTESNGILTVLPREDHVADGDERLTRRLKSCGKEWMLTQVRVVNDEDNDVKPGGEVGEIVARGDIVMKGYWKQPEATEETLRGGWLHTGDMGWIDEDGYIYIVDRKKDMIISGGENIYPKEIEEVIYTHPAVSEASVIGVPDEVWGESVKAIVSAKPGMRVTAEEIVDLCKQNLASYKKPKSVEVWTEELPKNPSGKILKTALRKKYTDPAQ